MVLQHHRIVPPMQAVTAGTRLHHARFAGCLLLVLAGCAGPNALEPPRAGACRRLLKNVDRVIVEAGAADAGLARLRGFPQLRADRFLASFARDPLSEQGHGFWLERMEKLGNEARRTELANLPALAAVRVRSWFSPGQEVTKVLEHCARQLTRDDLRSPARRSELAKAARVPDAYDGGARVLGLYPLVRIPFLEGVFRLHRELRTAYALPPAPSGRLVRYAPPSGTPLDRQQVAEILRHSSGNALGMPEPGREEMERLFESFAPVWEVDTRDDRDLIGTLRWGARGQPQVDTAAPVVYRLASRTRFGNRVLLQLNYLAWFPARAPERALDLYAGALDGLIWRVTLSPEGEPLAYDSIHPCGCYYQVFPGPGYRAAQPDDGGEPVLSPLPIGPVPKGRRLVLRLAARTHFIQAVHAGSAEGAGGYGWREYRELLSLPLPGGVERRNLFDPQGFVAGSERSERFLFWPMGVANAGAMRQWGLHAIAFVGRRHFDDARLLEGMLRPLAASR